MNQPVVAVCENMLRGVQPSDVRQVPVGASLHDLAPVTNKPVICTISGGHDYLLRKDWGYRVQPGDIVVFVVDPPQDRDTLRGLLQIALTVAAIFTGNPFIAILGNIALNALLPPTQPQIGEQKSASPTYSTSLSGNQARLDDPIPKICGRHRILPPFAAQPYFVYDANGDQIYHALFAVGIGNHTIERELIDDTDIRHFADVSVHAYLPPGQAPSTVLANVVTAPEISNQELKTGQYVGGFSACGPRLQAVSIGIDVVANRGLGYGENDGSISDLTVEWQVEWRQIDDFGAALTPWAVLANESKTASSNEVQRWSFEYTLSTTSRPEIRMVRTDIRDDSIRALHDIQWAGMRAYLSVSAPLNADTAHYEVVMRASEQLSNLSQRQIALIAKAHCRTWHPSTGWGAEVHTRNPAWWLADLWSSTTWGEGLADDRIDLQTLYDLSVIWDTRQDRFDYVFDTSVDAWEAAQTIARVGRARVFRRGGIMTLARDALVDLPVTAFTPRNTVPGSMVMSERLPTRDSADGVIAEYFDNRSWDWVPIECPCPGVTVMSNPLIQRFPGITGATHAEREGLYEAASMLYRTRTAKCTTEMQGLLPAYMSPVRWQPEIVGYGQSGDVTHWDSGTLVLGLSEQPVWGSSDNYLTLIRDDGTLTTPVIVTPGPTAWDVTLPAAPDFALVIDDGTRERPKWILGPQATSDELVKISAITDGGVIDGAQLYDLEAIVDDDRVHEVDNHLLPSLGDVQDPVDSAADVEGGDTGGGTLVIINLTDRNVSGSALGPGHCSITLRNDGVLRISATTIGGDVAQDITNEWIVFSPVELATASLYEVRAVYSSHTTHAGGDDYTTDILDEGVWDTWQALDTNRTWKISTEGSASPSWRGILDFDLQVREIATGIVQDIGHIRFFGSFDGGGA